MANSNNAAQIGNYDFALKLTDQLISPPNDGVNLFLSPASISVVLAICLFGARGKTRRQMKKEIFGLAGNSSSENEDDKKIEQWVNATLKLASETNDVFTLKFANRIYFNQRFSLNQNYERLTEEKFNSSAIKADFDKNAEQVAQAINSWVAQVTNGRIKNIIPKNVLGPSTMLALINALYFKGAWVNQFNEESTKKHADFFSKQNEPPVKVDMMQGRQKKLYAQNEQVQILELDYKKSTSSMIFILPKQKDGLKNLLTNLNGQTLKKWLDSLQTRDVIIEIPKFKMEQSFRLNDPLKRVGLERLFNGADFSGMLTQNKSMTVSDVLHKTFIELNENGTEAAAATAVIIALTSSFGGPKPEPVKFIGDHPFLFLLTAGKRDNRVILFLGQFYGKERH